jgi:hypothetical protein
MQEVARDEEATEVVPRAPQAGGSRVFLTPLATSPDPLNESRYKLSLGNRCVNAVWTLLTLEPCGAQVVLQYKSKVFMATATICNTQFVGVCDTWQPQDRDLLPGFTHGDAGWLCKFQLELALAMSKLISGANR